MSPGKQVSTSKTKLDNRMPGLEFFSAPEVSTMTLQQSLPWTDIFCPFPAQGLHGWVTVFCSQTGLDADHHRWTGVTTQPGHDCCGMVTSRVPHKVSECVCVHKGL